jgi:hypothetical protein
MASPSLDEASQTKTPYLPLSKKEVEILNSEGKVTKTFAGTGFSHSVDPKTVTRWAVAGKLTSIRTLGGSKRPGHRRYRESEVRELLTNNQNLAD